MVSMKPGSGTAGLDPEFDDNAGSPAEVERRRRRRAKAGARERASDDGGKETVGTRYGGPPPGTHGPWRWRQLVKGSALEKVRSSRSVPCQAGSTGTPTSLPPGHAVFEAFLWALRRRKKLSLHRWEARMCCVEYKTVLLELSMRAILRKGGVPTISL